MSTVRMATRNTFQRPSRQQHPAVHFPIAAMARRAALPTIPVSHHQS
jgi:hypothetical protein